MLSKILQQKQQSSLDDDGGGGVSTPSPRPSPRPIECATKGNPLIVNEPTTSCRIEKPFLFLSNYENQSKQEQLYSGIPFTKFDSPTGTDHTAMTQQERVTILVDQSQSLVRVFAPYHEFDEFKTPWTRAGMSYLVQERIIGTKSYTYGAPIKYCWGSIWPPFKHHQMAAPLFMFTHKPRGYDFRDCVLKPVLFPNTMDPHCCNGVNLTLQVAIPTIHPPFTIYFVKMDG
ncbi:hypothetical protein IV203_027128 [Nitzschia inconspicua]|uniref:Uncharacterized protein n=1 Tax=Nitzschia inconspicua TaxID=303405 RepID=A0A9K3LKL4_9STRA|nr:hypothetical protein IV203_027128 [Nitzschia inconspicua]